MPDIIEAFLLPLWQKLNVSGIWIARLNNAAGLLMFIGIVLLIAKLSATALLGGIQFIVKKTETLWDDYLEDAHFFLRLSRLVPAAAAYLIAPAFLELNAEMTVIIRRCIIACMIVLSAHICAAFLNGVNLIYQNDAQEAAKRRPIKGYIQLIKVFLYIICGILGVTAVINVSPVGILSGIGAMSAVLLLVFKDAILGFVSGIQLSGNDMVHIGDWIEMPKYEADGFVIDITLQSVKVRNWDNTISTVPVYALVSDSFKNWRGMFDSEGRRVKRSIAIDMRSVRFLTQEEIDPLSKIPLLAPYMEQKRAEITAHNKSLNLPEDDYITGRHLTNLGTYRAYSEIYLKNMPYTAKNLVSMVRYLPPDEKGIQMELYFFCTDKAWVNYEHIQADIIDHLLAVMPQFGLRVFQNPSGSDLQLIAEKLGSCKKV